MRVSQVPLVKRLAVNLNIEQTLHNTLSFLKGIGFELE